MKKLPAVDKLVKKLDDAKPPAQTSASSSLPGTVSMRTGVALAINATDNTETLTITGGTVAGDTSGLWFGPNTPVSMDVPSHNVVVAVGPSFFPIPWLGSFDPMSVFPLKVNVVGQPPNAWVMMQGAVTSSGGSGVWAPGAGANSAIIPGETNTAAGEAAIAYGRDASAYVAGSAVQSSTTYGRHGTISMGNVIPPGYQGSLVNGITGSANVFQGYAYQPTMALDIDIVCQEYSGFNVAWYKIQGIAVNGYGQSSWFWPGGTPPTPTLIASNGTGSVTVGVIIVGSTEIQLTVNSPSGFGNGYAYAKVNYIEMHNEFIG